jgi:serine phosphatase RsbU (regulator of sigma subunit)
VSGDFYWATEQHDRFYIATCDCTGHGVPGAFMSLLNISFLNENIIEKGISDPSLILDQQRRQIIKALNPVGNENSKDGMDCVLCSFDLSNNKLEFAAANNPLWLVRDEKIIEFNPDKMPVGKGEQNDKGFTLQSIDLQKGDMIYMFTDGFADQFGGPKGKKFMYRQLGKLILSVHKTPMNAQKQALSNELNSWKGSNEQVDDILVIGIRI